VNSSQILHDDKDLKVLFVGGPEMRPTIQDGGRSPYWKLLLTILPNKTSFHLVAFYLHSWRKWRLHNSHTGHCYVISFVYILYLFIYSSIHIKKKKDNGTRETQRRIKQQCGIGLNGQHMTVPLGS